jgi:hypothetical protein
MAITSVIVAAEAALDRARGRPPPKLNRWASVCGRPNAFGFDTPRSRGSVLLRGRFLFQVRSIAGWSIA